MTAAGKRFSNDNYLEIGRKNINFVVEMQQENGAWFYAADQKRDFVDHFHTCFVLKALSKVDKIIVHQGCKSAIKRGVEYYLDNLFDESGLPKPFSVAPRLTVYRNELYDIAEFINISIKG